MGRPHRCCRGPTPSLRAGRDGRLGDTRYFRRRWRSGGAEVLRAPARCHVRSDRRGRLDVRAGRPQQRRGCRWTASNPGRSAESWWRPVLSASPEAAADAKVNSSRCGQSCTRLAVTARATVLAAEGRRQGWGRVALEFSAGRYLRPDRSGPLGQTPMEHRRAVGPDCHQSRLSRSAAMSTLSALADPRCRHRGRHQRQRCWRRKVPVDADVQPRILPSSGEEGGSPAPIS